MLTCSYAQEVRVFGTVREFGSGEFIQGVKISLVGKGETVVSNEYGYYSLGIENRTIQDISFSKEGYFTKIVSVQTEQDTLLEVELGINELSEVVVTGENSLGQTTTEISIPVRELEKIPMVLGEPDLFKSLAFLPGVSTGLEGSSGLFVRGGTPDQNLILLDGSTVYNPSHLFGLFSVFHPEMVNQIRLIKSGFPSKYGGRLSSIIDVRMKEGNKEKFTGAASIGLINSRISLGGPLGRDKQTTFQVGGRISYIGALLKPILKLTGSKEVASYVMHDWNAKIHHQVNSKNDLFFSYYFGRDAYAIETGDRDNLDVFGLNWGNQTVNLRYKRIWSPRLFSNFSIWTTKFNHQLKNESIFLSDSTVTSQAFFQSSSSLRDYSSKLEFEWFPSMKHDVNFGFEMNVHRFQPGAIQSSAQPVNQPDSLTIDPTLEYGFFLEDTFRPLTDLTVSAGMRFSGYGVDHSQYTNWEPRFSAAYRLGKSTTLRASYTIMNQYLHQLPSNGLGIPNDLWVSSTSRVPPQHSQQASTGITHELSLGFGKLKLSGEAYLKRSRNLIEVIPGTNFLGIKGENWVNSVYTNGKGRYFGGELLVEFEDAEKLFNGWLSYTLSKSEQQFKELNQENWFPTRFDRRHNLSFVFNLSLRNDWEINTSWTYSSGHPVTLPSAVIQNSEGFFFPVFEERNNYRLPAFHRLDLGFIHFWQGKKGLKKSISFGVNNLYNRVNPLFLDYTLPFFESGDNQIKIYRRGGIPILPYFNYGIRF